MSHVSLPEQFAFLEPFVAAWGDLRTQGERYNRRQELPQGQLEAFHAALAPRLEEVFTHLDKFDPKALPEEEALLFRVVLGLTEASQAVEIFGQPRVPYAPYPHSVSMEWVGYQPH
ncbi:hypothetical protein [Novosphingobium sp. CECT 9465]|uniref:hypothetical protein n=1 Tax=Novosphingobium sp. CECT 9465 TaxID=2829794 RepID=UPI001E5C8DAA|nr:hypothetical protein [Novosphingobium sp. CECT 9465]CAH0495458.1 hypothetical protein NVSP9465_00464 [Novosphingobium sp. CECT 9465]